MNELSIHLKNLLSKYECVIVPGLGGFVTYFENAHWENNTLIPPMQQVRFNQNLTYHDGLLAEMYMKYYNIKDIEVYRTGKVHFIIDKIMKPLTIQENKLKELEKKEVSE